MHLTDLFRLLINNHLGQIVCMIQSESPELFTFFFGDIVMVSLSG